MNKIQEQRRERILRESKDIMCKCECKRNFNKEK